MERTVSESMTSSFVENQRRAKRVRERERERSIQDQLTVAQRSTCVKLQLILKMSSGTGEDDAKKLKFMTPTKKILSAGHLKAFSLSSSHSKFVDFLTRMNESAQGKPVSYLDSV